MIDLEHWREAQKSEASFWGQCLNTYGEETKQFIYLDRMGFKRYHDGRGPFAFDAQGKSFIDIGGGNADLWGISVPELGRQDIAIVTLFYSNQILPLTRTGNTWSAGTPITSPNLTWPLASVIMPLLA